MAKVFISYRHDSIDAPRATRMAGALRQHGHEVFIDRDMRIGTRFGEELRRQIETSDALVLLVTRAAQESDWILTELRVAVEAGKRSGSPRIFPLIFERFEWLMDWRVLLESLHAMPCADDDAAFDGASRAILASLGDTPGRDERRAVPTAAEAVARLRVGDTAYPRSALAATVTRELSHASRPVLIHGLPGVGKTTLLAQVAHQASNDFAQVIPLVFDGAAAFEPAYVLESVNACLGSLDRAVPETRLHEMRPEQAIDLLLAKFADQRPLFLLDGAEQIDDAWHETLLGSIQARRHARLVATTRARRQSNIHCSIVPVPPLSTAEATEFIESQAPLFGVDVDARALLARLPEAVRGHPQALIALLGQLRDVPLDLLLGGDLPDDVLWPVHLVAKAVEALGPVTCGYLALASAISGFDTKAALDALGIPIDRQLPKALGVLAGRALTHRAGDGYVVPAIVRHALARVDPDATDAALDRLVGAWLDGVSSTASEATGRLLARLGSHFAATCREQGRWSIAARLADEARLEELNRRGLWTDYSAILRVGAEAARHEGTSHRGLLFRLCRKQVQQGDIEGANAIFRELAAGTPVDAYDRAQFASHRGLLLARDGNLKEAVSAYEESCAIRESIGDREGLADVEYLLGGLLLEANPTDARRVFDRALARIGGARSKRRAEIEIALAKIDFKEGKLDAAAERIEGVLRDCDELGLYATRPAALLGLARLHDARGSLVDARRYAHEALDASENDPVRQREARALCARLDPSDSDDPEALAARQKRQRLSDAVNAFAPSVLASEGAAPELEQEAEDAYQDCLDFCLATGRDLASFDDLLRNAISAFFPS